MLYAVSDAVELLPGEEPFNAWVRYRTVGDMSCTGAVQSTAADLGTVVAEIADDADHRARRDARRRPRVRGRDGRPQDRGVLLAMGLAAADLMRLATAGSVDDGKSTLIGRLLFDSKQVLTDQLEHVEEASSAAAATAWSTSRCSSTACAPSASRASRSTSPTATSRPRGGRSSSPTPRATCSTRATWSPARRPPTSR